MKQILTDDATLRHWDERRRRLEALSGIVRGFLPRPLAERVRVTAAEDRELVLAADAGASAAILRQRTPDLLAALQREGWDFTGNPGPRASSGRTGSGQEIASESGR